MKPMHNGKTPGKISYTSWNTQAFFASAFSKENKKTGKSFASNTAIATTAVAGIFLIPSIAIISSIVSLGLLGGAVYFGLNSYHTGKIIENSSSYNDFIKAKEKKWKERKSGPSFKTRFLSKVSSITLLASYSVAIGATALAGVTALVSQGVVSVPLLTNTLSAIASIPATLGLTTAAIALPTLLVGAAALSVVSLTTAVAFSFKASKNADDKSSEKTEKKSFFKSLSFRKTKTAINDNSSKPAFESVAPKKNPARVVDSAEVLARKQRRQAAKANRR